MIQKMKERRNLGCHLVHMCLGEVAFQRVFEFSRWKEMRKGRWKVSETGGMTRRQKGGEPLAITESAFWDGSQDTFRRMCLERGRPGIKVWGGTDRRGIKTQAGKTCFEKITAVVCEMDWGGETGSGRHLRCLLWRTSAGFMKECFGSRNRLQGLWEDLLGSYCRI